MAAYFKGEIIDVPPKEKPGPCRHNELPQFQGLIGRLIICYQGIYFGRYISKWKILLMMLASEILPIYMNSLNLMGLRMFT